MLQAISQTGIITESRPYGDTTYQEQFWDDGFIDECKVFNGLDTDQFEALSKEDQEAMLITFQTICDIRFDRLP